MQTNLSSFIDVHIKVQKIRVATGNRLQHLKRQGKNDDRANRIYDMTVNLEDTLEKYIAEEFKNHPTYPWTSKIKGCGLEAAAKPIGIIEGVTFSNALLSDLRAKGIVQTKEKLKDNWADLETAHAEMFQRRSGIYAFDTPSRLRRFAGLAPVDGKAEKMSRGQKGLHYNPELRMMLWRLLTRLLQQRGYDCPQCNHSVLKDDEVCEACNADISENKTVVDGVWLKEYKRNVTYYEQRFERDGINVIPTPEGRFCHVCAVEKKVLKTTKNCPECGEKLMAKGEPEGVIFRGHLVNMAKRRTIRLWLDLLWVYWREALGLPTRSPWVEEYGKHTTMIHPMDMVDKPG